MSQRVAASAAASSSASSAAPSTIAAANAVANYAGPMLHFVVVTAVGDTVVYEAALSNLREEQQVDVDFAVHASLDTLDLLCREKPDCFFHVFEIDTGATGSQRGVSAYCPIGPYRLLLVAEPHTALRRGDILNFMVACSRTLADALRNPMAGIHQKIQSQAVRDSLRQQLERLVR